MKKLLSVIVVVLLCLVAVSDAGAKKQPRTSKNVRQQQKVTEQKIKQTDAQIKENQRQIKSKLNDLNKLQAETQTLNNIIDGLQVTIDSLDVVAQGARDSVAVLDGKLNDLKSAYADILRSTRRSRSAMGNLAFIFSSESFTQAFRRANALKQFSRWRQHKVNQINDVKVQLDERRRYVDSLMTVNRELAGTMALRRTELSRRASETDAIVNSLKGKDADLRKALREQQQQAAALERELDRIIQEEQRKAIIEEQKRKQREEEQRKAQEQRRREEEKRRAEEQRRAAEQQKKDNAPSTPPAPGQSTDSKTGGKTTPSTPAPTPKTNPATPSTPSRNVPASTDFAAHKGRLPYPVNPHTIVKRFGVQQHPLHKRVVTDNSGLDMETSSGAPVKSVFDGEVSAIICPEGYHNVVIVRHGIYMTVYANLDALSVRTGDKVKSGQQLGNLFVDTGDNNRSILHFEVRKIGNANTITKENPEVWLR